MSTQARCDPCVHCIHYYEDDRDYRHTGMIDYGCDAEDLSDDWQPGEGIPCPGFKPVLASEGLMEQLWEEEQYKMYLEDEKARQGAFCEQEGLRCMDWMR